MRYGAALAEMRTEMFAHALRYGEAGIGVKAVKFFSRARFVYTQRLAMGCRTVLFVRRAVTDMTVHDNQGRAVVGTFEGF